jgi:hypothetical protein
VKIIIIEGPDNTGKNTLINSIIENNNIVKLIHCGTPKSKDNPYQEQKDLFKKLSNIAISEYRANETDVIVFNRFYQGEYVYGQMYRNGSPIEIKQFIRNLESVLVANIFEEDLYYVQLLSSSPKLLIKNDDGKSLSEADENKIWKEIRLFENVFDESKIWKKKRIYINNGDCFRDRQDILNEFNNFINS